MSRLLVSSVVSGAMLAAGACQSTVQIDPKPAVLVKADAATMDHLKAALAKAMGRAQVELGPGDPTKSSEISVLPRPPSPAEGNSLAKPTIFRLETDGASCFVTRTDTGAREKADGVECKAAG
jgi:hypothetical protein